MAAPRALTAEQAMAQAAALFGRGDLAGAQVLCEAILRGDPRHFWALHLAATIALREERFADCVALAGRALEREPTHPDVLCNRGAALRHLNRIEEALADYDRALAGQPRSAVACNNRGVALAALNRHREAVESYSQALRIQPGYSSARFHRGLSLLTLGDFERGLEDYEARGDPASGLGPHRRFAQPAWTGREDVAGRTVLLHAEQGMGDTLQFCRYARLVKAKGATVIVEAHPPLAPLLEGVEGIDRTLPVGAPLPPFDFHCPLASLPRVLGTRRDADIPAGTAYVAAPAAHVERWRGLLGPRARPLIGLAWSGHPLQANDRNRSMRLEQLAPLLAVDATFVSLQKDVREADRALLERSGGLLDFRAHIADFRDTAALVSLADLVITVDTSVAHLAGAMGKPVWIMLCFSADWRYLLDREDSPWYPSARLFRQPGIGDWASVVQRVAAEARAFAGGCRPA